MNYFLLGCFGFLLLFEPGPPVFWDEFIVLLVFFSAFEDKELVIVLLESDVFELERGSFFWLLLLLLLDNAVEAYWEIAELEVERGILCATVESLLSLVSFWSLDWILLEMVEEIDLFELERDSCFWFAFSVLLAEWGTEVPGTGPE